MGPLKIGGGASTAVTVIPPIATHARERSDAPGKRTVALKCLAAFLGSIQARMRHGADVRNESGLPVD
jgi:hypothetical protein